MDSERRERIRNQAAVKTCARFILKTTFTGNNVLVEEDDEITLQMLEDSKYEPCSLCNEVDVLTDGKCFSCSMERLT